MSAEVERGPSGNGPFNIETRRVTWTPQERIFVTILRTLKIPEIILVSTLDTHDMKERQITTIFKEIETARINEITSKIKEAETISLKANEFIDAQDFGMFNLTEFGDEEVFLSRFLSWSDSIVLLNNLPPSDPYSKITPPDSMQAWQDAFNRDLGIPPKS